MAFLGPLCSPFLHDKMTRETVPKYYPENCYSQTYSKRHMTNGNGAFFEGSRRLIRI